MGVVYLATDPQLHRQVAVKTCALPDGISEEQAALFHERFLRARERKYYQQNAHSSRAYTPRPFAPRLIDETH